MADRVELGRFMYADEIGDVWGVFNRRSDNLLAYVEWETSWKQWVLHSSDLVVFSADCLEEIAQFLRRLNAERK